MSSTWSDPALAPVAELIAQRMGLTFSDARRGTVEQALRRARSHAGMADWPSFTNLLATDPKAFDALANSLTVDESYFFRDRAQFDFLREGCLPELASAPGPIAFWSAGCAAGQEPYSLAILADELGIADRVNVLGTDLSRARLATAARGRYNRWSLRGMPEDVVQRYFRPVDVRLELGPAMRRRVEFRQLNLADEVDLCAAPRGVDILLCRNVLIYFSADAIARAARQLIDSLSDRGWLLLGASDPAITDFVDCHVEVTPAGLAYRKPRSGVNAPKPQPVVIDSNRTSLARITPERKPSPKSSAPASSPIASETKPASIAASAKEVRALADRGALGAAIDACVDALRHIPTSAELAYLHAVLLAQSGRHPEAVAAARRALYLDRSLVLGHAALGVSLAQVGDRQGAIRSLKTALELLSAVPEGESLPVGGGETAARVRAGIAARLQILETP